MRILYLDLDALTPSHLSCYGYHRRTSPTIDAIAQQGVRCTNVYCSDAPCLPSRTAFYQGRFGIQTGVVGHGGTAADPKRQGPDRGFRSTYEENSMPRRLQLHGLHTAMISPFGQRHAAHHFYAGFNEVHNTGEGGMEPAEVVQPVVERWLKNNAAGDNWYLHINFWDIHTPYRAPASYGNPFENDPLPDWFTDELIHRHTRKTGPHSASDLGMFVDADDPKYPRVPARITDRASLRRWIDGYDTAIRYVDDQVAAIVTMLKEAGVYEETAIIISADHGENQGELGIYGEHGTADQATCNIPFIVRWPGADATAGSVDHGLHYNLDWAPTLLDLLGAGQRKPGIWDGESFADTITSGRSAGRDELVISQCAHVCQRGVRFDNWLYIRTYLDGFHLFPTHMLFDIVNDPHEQHDLAADRPDVLREATWRLAAWHDRQMAKMARTASDCTDPLWTVVREGGPFHARPGVQLRAYLTRLEATGRSDGAAALRERYASWLD
jgi:choline-sulfatase